MASLYDKLQNTASSMLTKYGQNLTLTREVETDFNPTTGAKSQDLFTFTGHGASFDYQSSEIDGELVQTGDIKLLLEKTTTAPAINDSVRIDNVNYRVMDVKKASPGGTVVFYTCRLRK